MLTCCLCRFSAPRWAPLFRFGFTNDLLGYITVHDTLLAYDLGEDGFFVAGHMNHVGNRNDILLNQRFTQAVLNATYAAVRDADVVSSLSQVRIFDPTSPNFYNLYLPTRLAREARTRSCVRTALQDVGCLLAGADVVLPGLCAAAGFVVAVEF